MLFTDLLLIAAFILTAVSGLTIYFGYNAWELHKWSGLSMFVFGVLHIILHRRWFNRGRNPEVWITGISLLIVSVSGLALYLIYTYGGEHYVIWGKIHWYVSCVTLVFGLYHTIIRISRLKNMIR